jgi:hypothetical protein
MTLTINNLTQYVEAVMDGTRFNNRASIINRKKMENNMVFFLSVLFTGQAWLNFPKNFS